MARRALFLLFSLLLVVYGCSGSSSTTSTAPAATSKSVAGMVTDDVPAAVSGASVTINSYTASGTSVGTATTTSNLAGSFEAASVNMADSGGYVVVTVQKTGYADYSSRIDFNSPADLNLQALLTAVQEVTVNVADTGAVFGAAASNQRAFVFGVVKDSNGRKRLVNGAQLRNIRATAGATTELQLVIPADSVPAGTTTLKGKIKTFDSSNPDDAKYFPGAYADSEGNKLVSLAFDHIDITDTNGTNLGTLTQAARAAGRLRAAAVSPTILTRQVPVGSCNNLLEDFCDGTGDHAKCAELNQAERDAFNVPVYTYNPNTGIWDLLGIGVIDLNNDGAITAADVLGTDVDGNGTPGLAGDYQAQCAADNGSYVMIYITNDDFIKQKWNLDYPIVYNEVQQLCVSGTVKDQNNNLVTNSYLSMMDDDNDQSFISSNGGYTDANGRFNLCTVLTDAADPDRSAILYIMNPFTYSYQTANVTLGSQNVEITVTKPSMCQVEGKLLDSNSQPVSNQTVYIYNTSIFYYTTATSNSSGIFTADVVCNSEALMSTGDWTTFANFNVNGATTDHPSTESSDNGTKVVLNDIQAITTTPGTLTVSVDGGPSDTYTDCKPYGYPLFSSRLMSGQGLSMIYFVFVGTAECNMPSFGAYIGINLNNQAPAPGTYTVAGGDVVMEFSDDQGDYIAENGVGGSGSITLSSVGDAGGVITGSFNFTLLGVDPATGQPTNGSTTASGTFEVPRLSDYDLGAASIRSLRIR